MNDPAFNPRKTRWSATSLSFDILNYASGVGQHLIVYNMAGVLLLEPVLTVLPAGPNLGNNPNNGDDFADSEYARLTVTSDNCIRGFSALPFGAEGNLSIDDSEIVMAAAPVPEPARWATMIGGFGLAGAAMRRRAPQLALA